MAFTIQSIEDMKQNEEWGGYGCLGERDNVRDSVKSGERPAEDLQKVAETDAKIVEYANARGVSEAQLFDWLNSRNGRHFADQMFGWPGTTEQKRATAGKHHLIDF